MEKRLQGDREVTGVFVFLCKAVRWVLSTALGSTHPAGSIIGTGVGGEGFDVPMCVYLSPPNVSKREK